MKLDTVIVPPHYIEITDPLIFLAGPIQGAPNWHQDAIALLHSMQPGQLLACPKRFDDSWKCDFAAQVDWETYHLRHAGKNGAIMFWLAKEAAHYCDRAYAQTTRFELAEWTTRHHLNGSKIVVGIENGFSGARYIRHRFAQDCPDVPLCSTLEEACKSTIAQIIKMS
ncbi:hypothetical protein HY639_01420 [Candidatus Woesearchaeota archaeon]|nr:hypothetical protein [Candidatus Woesearchaeota archaeon]